MTRRGRLIVPACVALGMGGCNAILGLGDPTVQATSTPDGSVNESGTLDGAGDGLGPDNDGSPPDAPADSRSDAGKDGSGDTGGQPPGDSGTGDSNATDSGKGDSAGTTGPWSPPTSLGSGIGGIWFGSLTQGVVALGGTSSGAGPLPGRIVAMTGPLAVASMLHGGTSASGEALTFTSLIPCKYGLVAATSSDVLVASSDNGASFTETPTGIMHMGGPAQLVWMFQDDALRWTAISSDGYIFQTAQATLSGAAVWTTVFPGQAGIVFTPETAPANPSVAQSPDGNTLMLVGYDIDTPTAPSNGVVETASSWGGAFSPVTLPVTNETGAYVIAFSSANNGAIGLAAGPTTVDGALAYAVYTHNGGLTWTASTLPAAATLMTTTLGLNNAFLSPDGSHIWLIGTIDLGGAAGAMPFVYVSSDGGATFMDVSSKLPPTLFMDNFVTGFAFDDTHIWMGSDSGDLVYSATGGQ